MAETTRKGVSPHEKRRTTIWFQTRLLKAADKKAKYLGLSRSQYVNGLIVADTEKKGRADERTGTVFD